MSSILLLNLGQQFSRRLCYFLVLSVQRHSQLKQQQQQRYNIDRSVVMVILNDHQAQQTALIVALNIIIIIMCLTDLHFGHHNMFHLQEVNTCSHSRRKHQLCKKACYSRPVIGSNVKDQGPHESLDRPIRPELTATSVSTPPWMGCQPIAGFALAVCWQSPG